MDEISTLWDGIAFLVKLAAGEGLALFIVVGGGVWVLWFFSRSLWPWYANTHRPAQVALREKEIAGDTVMSQAFGAQAAATHALTHVMSKALNNTHSVAYDLPDPVPLPEPPGGEYVGPEKKRNAILPVWWKGRSWKDINGGSVSPFLC